MLEQITTDISQQGCTVVEHFLPTAIVNSLTQEAQQLELRRAGVGKARAVNEEIRGDHILWLETPSTSQQHYLDAIEQVRLSLNSTLQLGLFEFEGHIAHYPIGSFYRKHLDRFQQDNHRILSCMLYLNQDWKAAQGGQLRLYSESENYLDVQPTGGTLVAFLSDQFWHEVLPATRDRYSITGWLKSRS